jgi:hypothetical protein
MRASRLSAAMIDAAAACRVLDRLEGADLAAGAPSETVGTTVDAGAVSVLQTSGGGPTASGG